MDFGEDNVFEAASSLAVVLILELTKLTAAIGAKAVQVAGVCQGKCVCLTAGNGNYLLVVERHDTGWVRLVWLALSVLR